MSAGLPALLSCLLNQDCRAEALEVLPLLIPSAAAKGTAEADAAACRTTLHLQIACQPMNRNMVLPYVALLTGTCKQQNQRHH